MLIPLSHENMQGRRWPVITIAIIALNVFVFLGTHGSMDKQGPELGEAKVHILMLAAMHPELRLPDKAQQLVSSVQTKSPALWKELKNPNRDLEDAWDVRLRLQEDPEALQQEMDSLSSRYAELDAGSILGKYAFVPGRPAVMTYITANFLHAGWLHLIGNMWFLWLAGAILEDTWGRNIYPAFYLIAGALALQVHALVNAGSLTPTIGASGAIAGLMGAFLVRFPRTKVDMAWIMMYRLYRFKAAAYWLLPMWLLTELFYGTLFGQLSGVAHWAHIGGFLFGALIAVVVRASGLEQMAEKQIQEKVTWVSHPLLAEATEQLASKQLDAAASSLRKLVQEKPDSIDAYRMLQNIYWKKNDLPAYRDSVEKLIELELKANDFQAAWEAYQDLKRSGAQKLPAQVWLDLCRQVETHSEPQLAADEYRSLAQAYPTEKQGLLAQIATGRIYLKRLNRPSDALGFYEAAQASPVPHTEWKATIERGIADANKALLPQTAPAAPAS
jgi:membrane associated rhomboid family serine protease